MAGIDSIASRGLQGIQSGVAQANKRADEISRASSDENVDVVESSIGLKQAVHQVEASAKIVKIADELTREIGNILDEEA